jgi:hypothetical protein
MLLLMFILVTKKWSVVEAKGNLPQGRFGHACAVNGPTMYIQVRLISLNILYSQWPGTPL